MTDERVIEERPIPFGAPMVRALLDDRKSQTRRVCKPALGTMDRREEKTWAWGVYPASEPGRWVAWFGMYMENAAEFSRLNTVKGFACPYGRVGDRLWVTEVWTVEDDAKPPQSVEPGELADWRQRIIFHADCESTNGFHWRAPFLLPRWASRITLEITDLRVERVQAITEGDARAEGVVPPNFHESRLMTFDARRAFAVLWDDINAKRERGWEVNPWVWAVGFRRI